MKYKVILKELNTGFITVEAPDEQKAKDLALKHYDKGNCFWTGTTLHIPEIYGDRDNYEEKNDIRQHAQNIIDIFEELLEYHNIYIPDEFRSGSEDEACLYGDTYYALEDMVSDYIEKIIVGKTEC